MEITVASTTDTDAAVRAVAGLPEKEEKTVQVAEPEPKEQVAAEEEKPEPKPSKSANQRRFDAMTRRMKELEAELQAVKQPKVEPQPEPEPEYQLAPRPKQDDKNEQGQAKYATYEDYEDALMDWKIDQRQMVEAQRAAEQAAAESQQRIQESFNEQCREIKTKYPDFDEALRNAPQIYTGVGEAIKELENGAEVAYYIATHRDIAQKLSEWGPLRAIAEVGRIAAQIGTNVQETEDLSAEAETEPEEEPVHKASPPPRKAVSAAPAPLKTVGGSSTKSSVPLGEMEYQDYRRIRDQQIKARYRR